MTKKTDVGKIQYPQGLSVSDRRHCRKMITTVVGYLKYSDQVVISCSGGIDSTVLVHAVGQATRLAPVNERGRTIRTTAVYLNHQLRPHEVDDEMRHVTNITQENLSYVTSAILLDVTKGSSLQERARDARYDALESLAQSLKQNAEDQIINILTAHNANDVVETKLFQFLKGKNPIGILPVCDFRRKSSLDKVFLTRPFLEFSREDIMRYAKLFQLTWREDSSNETDKYTRNKIRHHLIPWIQENINPGIITTLSRVTCK